MNLFELFVTVCIVFIILCAVIPVVQLSVKTSREAAKEREKQAQAAAREAEKKRKADEADAARQAREEERQRKQAARLEAARQLAEYKERALQAEKELRAMRQADKAQSKPRAAKQAQEPPVAQLRKPAAKPQQQPSAAPTAVAPLPTAGATSPRNDPQDRRGAAADPLRVGGGALEAFAVSCMLAKKYADNRQEISGKAFTITEKLDGVRCIARMEAGRVELYARSGKRIEGLTEIEDALNALHLEGVLDGELLIKGRGVLPSKEEYKQTCAIVRTNGKKTGIVYHVFDVLPLADYRARRSTIPYCKRRVALERIKAAAPFVEVVPVLYSGTDTAQIEKQLQQQREAHHEGIMINLNDAPYSFARSACLLKYKIMSDCDLRIVALNPGTGSHADMLGSFSLEYKGGIVRVGAGIPNATRRAIWANPAAYIGRVVTVQYFEETQDKRGQKSLRFPVFKELREIGKAVSYA